MSKLLIAQQLLNQHSVQDVDGNISLSLEANLLLNDSVLANLRQLLKNDSSIRTIEIVSKEGNILGYLPRKAISDCIRNRMHDRMAREGTLGGDIGQPEGKLLQATFPRFRCSVKHCSRELIVADDRQQPIFCPACGLPMILVE